MTLILQLIQTAGKTSTVLEDAFLVVGSLASGNILPFSSLHFSKQFSTHSTWIQLHTLHPSLPPLPVPCSESTRRYSALYSGCGHYRRYLACSWWTKCPICESFHDCSTRKSPEWRFESKCQDFYFVMLWWYRSCYWPVFRALSWDYIGRTSSSRCSWTKPRKSRLFSYPLRHELTCHSEVGLWSCGLCRAITWRHSWGLHRYRHRFEEDREKYVTYYLCEYVLFWHVASQFLWSCHIHKASWILCVVAWPTMNVQIHWWDCHMVSLETWQILSLLDSLNSCSFKTGLPLNYVLDIVCQMRRRRRCVGPARFVIHFMTWSSCQAHVLLLFYRWWKSLPSRTCSFLFWPFQLCFYHVLLPICLKFLTFIFLLTVPSMHAIYISRFSFSIAISRRHIIKSRLACNIKRMDLLSSGSTYDNIFVISFTFGFFRQPHVIRFFPPACIVSCSKSGFHFSILSPHLFSPSHFNDHTVLITGHQFFWGTFYPKNFPSHNWSLIFLKISPAHSLH